jgi:hypothetical protein
MIDFSMEDGMRMTEAQRAEWKVRERLHTFTRIRATWHVIVSVESGLLNLPSKYMRRVLLNLSDAGYIRLTSWSKPLNREADYREFATLDDFFFNRDDCNYVRVTPLVAF